VPQGLDNLTILFTLWNKAKPSAKRIPQGKFDYFYPELVEGWGYRGLAPCRNFFENEGFSQSVNLSATKAKATTRAGMEKPAIARRKEKTPS
jgi:hypothetical protein